jgi:8-oxo-dGTP pyrophosphatase MutT (NUDIX family)
VNGINIWTVKDRLSRLLRHRRKRRITDPGRVQAAVLLPLYNRDGQDHIVFIKRTEIVSEHKGQISFPGGSREQRDGTMLDTALRESHEEIGLKPGDVEVLGELDDEITTTSNYIVTPFVGMMPWPYRFIKNDIEVDEVIEVPIPALLEKGCLQPDTEVLNGKIVDSYAYNYEGRIIWGATARILNRFMEIYIRSTGIDE